MPISMHRASIPMFRQSLAALSRILDTAAEFGAANGISEEDFLARRLAPDMFTLAQQVQRATFHAAQCAAKLTQGEIPSFADDEKSFADLKARIQYTVDYFATLPPESFDGSEDRDLEITTRLGVVPFIGQDYLFHFAIPQFLFHTTTAYGIIRNAGVEVGKRHFLGDAADR